jgi:hypothetical protein
VLLPPTHHLLVRTQPSVGGAPEALTILWVPDFTILGARYGALVQQAVVERTITGIPPRGVSSTETGLNNTLISPINLAWTLSNDVFVSARFAVHLPNGQYDRHKAREHRQQFLGLRAQRRNHVSEGRVRPLPTSPLRHHDREHALERSRHRERRYHSGNILSADYTASQAFGNWRFSVTGTGVWQTHNDSAGGRTLRDTTFSNSESGR